MKFARLAKVLLPAAAFALAGTLAGCDGHVSVGGKDGKKLSELDLSGKKPTELVLAGRMRSVSPRAIR